MNSTSFYILRHPPGDLSSALYSQHDHHGRIFSVCETSDLSHPIESTHDFSEESGFISEGGERISYQRMVELVIAAKKVIVL